MTQTTRCPACATRFKIVPDQLKIGQGWARCGQCGEVFDARLSLKTLSPSAAVSAPAAAAVSGAPPAPAPAASSAPVAHEPASVPAPAPDVEPDPLPPLHIDPPAHPPGDERIAPVFDDLRIDIDAPPEPVPARDPLADPAPYPRPEPSLDPQDGGFAATPAATTATAGFDPASDLSFVRRARRRAAWQRPWVRVVLMVLTLGLSLLLALQAAFHYRDLLASQYPALRPLLAALCEQAQCLIGPPRRIDVIAIDGSSFTRLQGDTYRLGVNLTNQSTAPVAMPAIELTLTDAQDQPVLRRVLQPADFGADTPDRIAGGGEWSLSASILVAGAANVQRIAGYRVLAFYP